MSPQKPKVVIIGAGFAGLRAVSNLARANVDILASNLKRQLRGLSPKPFHYFNKGTAAIIARNAGVADLLGRIPLKGWLAWLLWLGIHLYYLPGLSNRLIVLGSCIRDYFTGERNSRQFLSVYAVTKLDFKDAKFQKSQSCN